MAKLKNAEKPVETVTEATAEVKVSEEVTTNEVLETKEIPETPVEQTSAQQEPQIDMNRIYQMFNEFQTTINTLKEELDKEKKKNSELVNAQTSSGTDRLIELLGNKKSDREITIIHNRELLGGLSTAIRLTGMSIDFHTLGEQRILSWQQFEECVSKYHKWFEKQIILLGPEHEDLSERYNVPCLKRAGKTIITKADLQTLHKKTERELEDFFMSLTEEDKGFVCSYWLGKCYEHDGNYLNRSKIELLNRLSKRGVFDTLLTAMNFDSVRN